MKRGRLKVGSTALNSVTEQRASGELQGLVFDVDGVLFDSRTSNIEFYNCIRRAVHLPPLSPDEENFCHMASTKECLAHIIPPSLRKQAEEARRALDYHERIMPLLSPTPGLVEALSWLRSRKVLMGIFTNRANSVTDLLRHFGLEEFFSVIKTAENCMPKPHSDGLLEIAGEWRLERRRMAFIGDSRVDEEAAARAGISFWAFGNERLNATLHFNDFFTMISWIAPLVEQR